MKLNICYPALSTQKAFTIDDENKVHAFFEKRMSQEVEGDSLGDEWKGYVFRITGGNDKQGFPMKQGVLTNYRVRLLLSDGHSCYRARQFIFNYICYKKSVRGCIVGADLSVLNLMVVKKGEQDIPGLTDLESAEPRRLGPKRASNIRKLFNLTKKDDVRKYVIHREFTKDGKKHVKAPKIQRLVTHLHLVHKRQRFAALKAQQQRVKEERTEYERLVAKRNAAAKSAAHKKSLAKKSSIAAKKSSVVA
ncbi:hypothetical protein WA158_001166 [Blastocystis sp. Blastoise]